MAGPNTCETGASAWRIGRRRSKTKRPRLATPPSIAAARKARHESTYGSQRKSAAHPKMVLPSPANVIAKPIAVARKSPGKCSDR